MSYRSENNRGRRIPGSNATTPPRRSYAQLKPQHALLSHLAGAVITVAFILGLTGTIALTLRTMLQLF